MTSTQHADYKEAKEAFVSQLEGGSIARINAVSLTALTTYALWSALRSRGFLAAAQVGTRGPQHHQQKEYKRRRRRDQQQDSHDGLLDDEWPPYRATYSLPLQLCVEFLILIAPIIFACTTFSGSLILLNGSLAGASAFVVLSKKSVAPKGTAVPSQRKKHWAAKGSSDESDEPERPTHGKSSSISLSRHARQSSTHYVPRDNEPPLRVSIERADDDLDTSAKVSNAANGSAAKLPARDDKGSRTAAGSPYIPKNRPFLTVYRAHMMLMTIVCILAVDFPAFPREFAKCETWGTSLMDLGVGSFVFSLGLVSAYPMLRAPSQRFKPMRFQLMRDARRSLPLLLLGSIRVIMVKGVDYPEHVAEYGVHWNFFITLALLPFFGTLCRPLARALRFSTLGLLFAGAHQLALSQTSLGTWASSNAVVRDALLSQNKEGLVSLPGYAAIYLLGLDLGHYLLPRDPFLAYRRASRSRQQDKLDKLAMVLLSFAVLYWAAFYMQRLALGSVVSRRLANLAYVLWVTAYNTSFLLAYVAIYMALLQPLEVQTRQDDGSGQDDHSDNAGNETTPLLFQALNGQAFAVFLLANLLTGLINMSMQTMYASNIVALVVVTAYVAGDLGFAAIAHTRRWRLKI